MDAVRRILRQQAGIDIGNTITLPDGSGLSRHPDRSRHDDAGVLQYIANDNELNFISMLPLAGYDGSLQYLRAGLHQAGVDGKVSAKPGHCRACIIWRALLPPQAGNGWHLYGICPAARFPPADQRNRRIPLVRFESIGLGYLSE